MSPIRSTRISKQAAETALRMYSGAWRRYPESRIAAEQLKAALIVWEETCSEVGAAEAARPMDGYRDPLLELADNGTPVEPLPEWMENKR